MYEKFAPRIGTAVADAILAYYKTAIRGDRA
jgi:hypothetical protein